MTTTAAHTNSASNTTPNYDAAMAVRKEESKQLTEKKKMDKKSPEYLVKSGLAGGFAGCAVRHHMHTHRDRNNHS